MNSVLRCFVVGLAAVMITVTLALAGPPASSAEKATATPVDGATGFVSIFNGKDLTGWDGNPKFWSVKDGVMRGETTPDNPTKGNTFCIWRGEKLKNFVLKIKFRLRDGNSGIQYRSTDLGDWRVGGYQAEVENGQGKVGLLYHERGRGHLARVGQFVEIDDNGKKNVVGQVGDVKAMIAAGYYKEADWNEYTITARGGHIVQVLNGFQTIELIDNDRKGAAAEGILALQLHAGRPMLVEFKDIRVKALPDTYGPAVRLFNGKDLTGWTVSSDALNKTWSAADGLLVNAGRPAGYLRTKATFTSYVLRMQLRHQRKGNCGVLLRVTGPDKVWPRSIEAQGQAGALGDIWNIGKFPMTVAADRTRGRHTRKMHPSNENPIGQWNRYEIDLNGGVLAIKVNGLVQNIATDCEVIPGTIGLQSEGTPVDFRNIVLIPIAAGNDTESATSP